VRRRGAKHPEGDSGASDAQLDGCLREFLSGTSERSGIEHRWELLVIVPVSIEYCLPSLTARTTKKEAATLFLHFYGALDTELAGMLLSGGLFYLTRTLESILPDRGARPGTTHGTVIFHMTDQGNRGERFRQAALLGSIPMVLVAGPVAGFLIGNYLDRWLGTSPWLKILFILLGAATAIRRIAHLLGKIGAGEDDRG